MNKDNRLEQLSSGLNDIYHTPQQWDELETLLFIKHKTPYKLYSALAMAAMLLILFAVYFTSKSSPSIEYVQLLDRTQILEVARAEQQYIKAIEKLEEKVLYRAEFRSIQLKNLYENKMHLINNQIAHCKAELRINPGNAHIHRYLLAALRDKKETLLEMANSGKL